MSDMKALRVLIYQLVDSRQAQSHISPSWIATEALAQLDPTSQAPVLVGIAAHFELRQLARACLRLKFEPEDGVLNAQHDLWPQLQTRYPIVRGQVQDEPQYAMLESLSKADVAYNVARLRKEGQAKIDHADALEDWWQEQRQTG